MGHGSWKTDAKSPNGDDALPADVRFAWTSVTLSVTRTTVASTRYAGAPRLERFKIKKPLSSPELSSLVITTQLLNDSTTQHVMRPSEAGFLAL